MRAEAKALWVDALLSGAYAPGPTWLRTTDDTYSPCGVLCDVYMKATNRNLWIKSRLFDNAYECHGNALTLPRQVREWAGFGLLECPNTVPLLKTGRPLWVLYQEDNLNQADVARLVEANF